MARAKNNGRLEEAMTNLLLAQTNLLHAQTSLAYSAITR
jgi:hypothetical protein